ncbi:MAG: hypothetical protein AAFV53_32270, partial [Myxococcota bacterium]
DTDTDTDTDVDTDAIEGYFRFTGITEELQAFVQFGKAFSYVSTEDPSNPELLVYMTSNNQATCTLAGDYLSTESVDDPSRLFTRGYCNLLFKFGDIETARQPISFLEPFVSIECPMGGGEWSYNADLEDWVWSEGFASGTIDEGEIFQLSNDTSGASFRFDPDSVRITYVEGDDENIDNNNVPNFGGTSGGNQIVAEVCTELQNAAILGSGGDN